MTNSESKITNLEDETISVFICYSHADKAWHDRLKVHLAPLRDIRQFDDWSDQRILAGTNWREEIRKSIEKAHIAILLVSADFLASKFIQTNELPPLLSAADLRQTLILPIVVGPCLFSRIPRICEIHAINDPEKSLLLLSPGEQECVFRDVAERLWDYEPPAQYAKEVSNEKIIENFTSANHWPNLIRIGNWVFSEEKIRGSGMNSYLLSNDSYGTAPFTVEAEVKFTDMRNPVPPKKLGFNGGFIFGWIHEHSNPRYYNFLLTGEEVIIELIGANGGTPVTDYQHRSKPVACKIEPGVNYKFKMESTNQNAISFYVNDKPVLTYANLPGILGRVGLRPWRSTVTVSKFVISHNP